MKGIQMKMHHRIMIMLSVLGLGVPLAWVFEAGASQVRVGAGSSFADFQVTNANDSGSGSLREAITAANANPGTDSISISASGTLQLLSPLPVITDPVLIQGPVADEFIVDGNHNYRVLDIGSVDVSLADFTIQNGFVTGVSANGAGIRSAGKLVLLNMRVLSNSAQSHGGGLYITGELTSTDGIFQNNTSTNGVGGGIRASGSVTINGTQFVGNSSRGDGGGAFILGHLTITNALFQDNSCTASSCDGGGLFSFSQTNIQDTQFLNNTVQDQGGGLAAPGVLTITGGLFQNNQAGSGGGLFAQNQVTIQTTHFANNNARSFGGGIYSLATSALTDVLFIENQSTTGKGGALYSDGDSHLSRVQFIRNSAREGGGLYHALGDGNVENSLFAQNIATDFLGMAMLLASDATTEVRHVTIAGTEDSGGTAIAIIAGNADITNTIITLHTIGINNDNASVHQDYNLFFGNLVDLQGGISGGGNNLNGDPLFADPAQFDYHITEGSAAIDAGTDAGVNTDFDGDTRPMGESFDIGFDEIMPPTDQIPLYSFYLPLVRSGTLPPDSD
jgi:predicted outer membrane repeat protein